MRRSLRFSRWGAHPHTGIFRREALQAEEPLQECDGRVLKQPRVAPYCEGLVPKVCRRVDDHDWPKYYLPWTMVRSQATPWGRKYGRMENMLMARNCCSTGVVLGGYHAKCWERIFLQGADVQRGLEAGELRGE